MGETTQDYILGYSQPSLRDWFVFSNPTQHCVLGYSQPSLRDSTPNQQVLTPTLLSLRRSFQHILIEKRPSAAKGRRIHLLYVRAEAHTLHSLLVQRFGMKSEALLAGGFLFVPLLHPGFPACAGGAVFAAEVQSRDLAVCDGPLFR
jgi:hypothetical protein